MNNVPVTFRIGNSNVWKYLKDEDNFQQRLLLLVEECGVLRGTEQTAANGPSLNSDTDSFKPRLAPSNFPNITRSINKSRLRVAMIWSLIASCTFLYSSLLMLTCKNDRSYVSVTKDVCGLLS